MEHGLSIKCKTIKLREKKQNLQNLGLDKEFLDLTTKAQFVKGKIDELHFIKIKNFGSAKDPVKRVKKIDWEKIFAHHMSDKYVNNQNI